MGAGWIQSEGPGVCLQDKSMTGSPGRSLTNRGKEPEQGPSRMEVGEAPRQTANLGEVLGQTSPLPRE